MMENDRENEIVTEGGEGLTSTDEIVLNGKTIEELSMCLDNLTVQSDGNYLNGGMPINEDSGQEVQRISVITNLPDLLQDHHGDCMRRIVPKVREVLHVAQAEMQMAACKAFLQILQGQLVPLQNYTQTFLQTIILAMDSRDPDVSTAWLDTLLDVIDLLPKDVIRKDILSIAIAKGQLSQSVRSRLACCSILGKIATKFEPFVIKKDILPLVQSLCQDVEYEVRGCMCRQLDAVARGLGLESTKSAILPELVELTDDEESYVRLAGLETVVRLLSLLDSETCVNTIIPLVHRFCKQALDNEDATLPEVAKQLGKLCHGLQGNLTDSQKHWFVDFYKELCCIGSSKPSSPTADDDVQNRPKSPPMNLFGFGELVEEEEPAVQCRRNAAYNMPAMVMFTGVRNFHSELYQTLGDLCSDPNASVRHSVAAGFHEIVKLLGNKGSMLMEDLITLLNDSSIEVLKGVIPYLPENLSSMLNGDINHNEHKGASMTAMIHALSKCEAVIASSHDWRLHKQYIDQLPLIQHCFSNDDVYHKFVPLLFRKFHTARALPVRHASVTSLLIILRKLKRWDQRNEICKKLVEELCYAPSCHQRLIFIVVCEQVIEMYSRAFFKQYFFETLLDLLFDPVPNVRLRLCPMLPKLKGTLILPTDRQLLQMLEQSVRKVLLNENDRDVNEAANKAVEKMDGVNVQMQSATKTPFLEQDIQDKKKEEVEQRLIEQEEEERRREEEQLKSASKERHSVHKKDSTTVKKGSKITMATSMSSGKERPGASSRSERGSASSTRESKTSASKLPSRGGKGLRSPKAGQRSIGSSSSSRKGSASSLSSSPTAPSYMIPAGRGEIRRASISNTDVSNSRVRKTGIHVGPSPVRKKSLPR